MTLSARIASASVEQTRDMLEEAWEYLCQNDKQFRRWGCEIIDDLGITNAGRFANAVEFGFYHDAGMMLIKPGWILQLSEWDHDKLRERGPWQAILIRRGTRVSLTEPWTRCDHAASAPLAIAAAAVKVKEICDE